MSDSLHNIVQHTTTCLDISHSATTSVRVTSLLFYIKSNFNIEQKIHFDKKNMSAPTTDGAKWSAADAQENQKDLSNMVSLHKFGPLS